MSGDNSTTSSAKDKTHERIPSLKVSLASQADYPRWRSAAEIILEYYDNLELMLGNEVCPAEEGESKKWRKRNVWAKAFLVHNIDPEVFGAMASASLASEMWKNLEDMFDRRTTSTLHQLAAKVFNLQYSPEVSLKDHVATFATAWKELSERTEQYKNATDESFSWIMNKLSSNVEAKGSFLLMSLRHESLDNVVDNLQTKEKVSYQDVYDKLMDIATRRELSLQTAESLNASKGRTSTPNPRNATKECSFCKKNGDNFLGHLQRECRKRKAKKKEETAETNVVQITAEGWTVSFLDFCFIHTDYPEIPVKSQNELGNEYVDLSGWDDDDDGTLEWMDATSLATAPGKLGEWILDTGATDHMSGTAFDNKKPAQGTVSVPGDKLEITGVTSANVSGSLRPIHLEQVLHVPRLGNTNLISWRKLAEKGLTLEGKGNELGILRQGQIQARAILNTKRNLYILETKHESSALVTVGEWHERLGHLPSSSLTKFRNMIQDPENLPKTFGHCPACALGKSTRLPRLPSTSPLTSKLELIHTDLSGMFPVKAPGGFHYFVSFIDDCTRLTTVYLLKSKDDTSEAIISYIAKMERSTNLLIKRFRSDNGGEYINRKLIEHFRTKGISHETIVPHSHESNGVAERFNRTIQDMVRTVGITSGLPRNLWGEAISMLTHVKNRVPHRSIKKTPFEAWHGRKPTISHLRRFGETAYTHIPKEARKPGTKLEPRALEGKICGYGETEGEYRVYIPSLRKVIRSRDVQFVKTVPELRGDIEREDNSDSDSDDSSDSNASVNSEDYQTTNTEDNTEEIPADNMDLDQEATPPSDGEKYIGHQQQPSGTSEPSAPSGSRTPPRTQQPEAPTKQGRWTLPPDAMILLTRKSKRTIQPPKRFDEEMYLITSGPQTFEEAVSGEDEEKWVEAMDEEYDALLQNQVWSVVPRPANKKVVRSRWVYHPKLGPDGQIVRYKARFVAKGFSQVQGVDYNETFSPVFRYESIRILFALMATHSDTWTSRQSDVKNAFLNGELQEEVFLEQPKGYEQGKGCVLKLRKTLYGLNQSPREWHNVLFDELKSLGLRKSSFDPSVYINSQNTLILAAFVDDFATFSRDDKEDSRVAKHLATVFRMTDNGTVDWIVGIRIRYLPRCIQLDQSAYLKRVLERFEMTDCRPVKTPFENHQLIPAPQGTANSSEITRYQEIIGSLMYAAIGTRPDLVFAVTFLSSFSTNPGPDHWIAIKRVLRYLKGTINVGLVYPRRPAKTLQLVGYADASHAADLHSRHSTSGNCFLLNECLITWRTEKQKSVAISSTEAEYMVLSEASRQLIWLKRGMEELKSWKERRYTLKGDNTGALSLVKNPVFHKRSKHIDVHFHYVREQFEKEAFKLEYVPTAENLADLFTKGLERIKHQKFMSQIGCLKQGGVLE